MFFRILLVVAMLVQTSVAMANPNCDGCKEAADAQNRWAGVGIPDFTVDCFRVETRDVNDSSSVTIWRGDHQLEPIPFPRGAFVKFGGKKPALCLLPSLTDGATKIVIIPGNQRNCVTLDGVDIWRLRHEHVVEDKACMDDVAWCAVN